ncbi:MASE1 domain-containing protein [Xanthomonas rydalmerensis]|uniref:MASE1 domain-containing protein n=1 Tax=Xanthomonas rydalmerensis TaxID=3046274 RepID=A0ABZ0JTK9_9XANT|nr:MASE1 domain-containing protein [Xanthomonas sp. DM-2023]WOS42736.1 MASE1 domain-containing protein [Xanthomonas sp. DM-2023]WOS46922.1 MASE1 domain-containing protein [Xanthomonas sp. DM-2023]WOS51101.1 MASE1 domain-containing protein [Xanthomonas sp. DM-2023]WOS55282.1 MASE1 domain-containing protein [Xanthomonas sp. DM-2023]WOS59464.1 MASE1 domain-containing protein [Xanthomonas sp. DM-2023]
MAARRDIAKGALLSAAYCASFLLAWRYSMDQWYLPAGLRAATLLFMPYRFWPYLLAGDAAALLTIRVPMVERGASPLWAYASPFLLMPCVALAVHAGRRHLPRLLDQEYLLLPLSLAFALWSTLCNVAMNVTLKGYTALTPMEALARYWLGDYLGMLMFVLPSLLWLRRKEPGIARPRLPRDVLLGCGAVVALFLVAGTTHDHLSRQMLMGMMVIPAIVLTLLHGWRGAAAGVVLANVAIGIMLPDAMTLAAYHAEAFRVQIALAAAATGLFVFGSRLSIAFERAGRFRHERQEALQFAQASYLQAERTLRRRVVEYSDLTVHINKLRKDIVSHLRSRGQHAAAMEMTRSGVIQARLLDEYVTALYPLGIETHGLFETFRSVALSNLCDTEFRCHLRGDPMRLSLGLQLVAYRCVLNVVETLPPAKRHLLKARVWRAGSRQGIAVCVVADVSPLDRQRPVAREADWELAARLKVHGGTCRRRHAYSLSFLVSESVGEGINLRR